MIIIIETPQRSDYKLDYIIEGDTLTITTEGMTETFVFTDLPEGRAEEIIPENLPICPIISAEKIGYEVTITLIRFYGEDEKEVYENGEDQMGV